MKTSKFVFLAVLSYVLGVAGIIANAQTAPKPDPAQQAITAAQHDLSETKTQLAEVQKQFTAAQQVISAMQAQRNQLAQQMLDIQVQLQLAQQTIAELSKPKEPADKASPTSAPEKK